MNAPVSLSRQKSGMTLVLALFVIVLLTMLIVGLLFQSQSSQKGSQLHVEALRAKQLGESAMSVVTSRIQEATRTQAGDAWASQPGAIRVYGSDGNLKMLHKLYSAASGTTANASDVNGDLPPADWETRPNLFVDMNAPISTGGGLTFPIVDPRLYSGVAGVDPEGFSYSGTAANGTAIAGTVPPGGAADTQRVPMPVRWLYVLSNGEMVAPVDLGDGTVSVPGAGPNAEIIGRIAFWTDDETSKVNVNTAAGGEFWDTPRMGSNYEKALANSQPVQGEFQRYPGHSATVDLRAVFPWIADSQLETFYDFVPKIRAGGSKGGSVETSVNAVLPAPIAPDADRLYAATGEAKYKPDRTEFGLSAPYGGDFSTRIERGDFLLTTSSRAPELNLFGRPRVAIWPLDSVGANRSPLDKLIAFCASIKEGGATRKDYFFQRAESTSPTYDYEGIERNRELLAYLRTATGKTVPGFGGDFQTKYTGPVRDQILTEIFDYVRAATNLKDPQGKKYADPDTSTLLEPGEGQVTPIWIDEWKTKGFGRFLTVSEGFFWFTWQGDSETPAASPVVGLSDPPDVPTATEMQMQAIFSLQFAGVTAGYSEYVPDITVKIEGLHQFTLNGVNMGFPSSASVRLSPIKKNPIGAIEDFRVMVAGRDFGPGPTNYPFYSNVMLVPKSRPGGQEMLGGPITITLYAGTEAPANLVQTIVMQPPALGARFSVPEKVEEDSGPTKKIYIKWGTTDAADRFAPKGGDPASLHGSYMFEQDRTRSLVSLTGDHRLTAGLRNVPSDFFIPHQGRENELLATAWQHTGGTRKNINSLMTPLGYGGQSKYSNQLLTGKLDANVTLSSYPGNTTRANVPTHVQGKKATNLAWDWDTGMALQTDGAYINKPDEGSLGGTGGGAYFAGPEVGSPPLTQTMFLPNRQVVSPGMFGSLPTGINPANPTASKAWQTLLLRPDPLTHPGNSSPKDHLLLDFFWMPVVEPYAISEPFSTAGKINMNFEMLPFSHITRETGLYALLRNERLLAMKPTSGGSVERYKGYNASPANTEVRPKIDAKRTLNGFRTRLDGGKGKLFVSPTEIATLYLVPQGVTMDIAAYWADQTFTGDNVRERPYANLLAKLTTKSNSYSVHVIAQALKKGKTPGSNPAVFGQKADRVTGEWRGTFLIERFLDSNDPKLPDFAGSASLANWDDPAYNADNYYQTRVLQVREWR